MLMRGVAGPEALPQFLRRHEAGADPFAISPGQPANAKHLAARSKGQAEYLRYRQRADLKGNTFI
jgi:hypothetical protein